VAAQLSARKNLTGVPVAKISLQGRSITDE